MAVTFVHELAEKVRPLGAALSIAFEGGGLSNYHLSPPFRTECLNTSIIQSKSL